jgi:hypothetical protein
MNPGCSRSCWPGGCRRGKRGHAFTLVECLVYVGLLGLILSLALMTFYRTEGNHRNLARNADDITRVLRAGEQWREDIRQAVAPIQWRTTGAEPELVIPHSSGLVKYSFRNQSVWRQGGPRPVELLPEVAVSKMEKVVRPQVSGWRWEVELKGRQRVARVKPLFTFLAATKNEKP